jgi:hypothetical protein
MKRTSSANCCGTCGLPPLWLLPWPPRPFRLPMMLQLRQPESGKRGCADQDWSPPPFARSAVGWETSKKEGKDERTLVGCKPQLWATDSALTSD